MPCLPTGADDAVAVGGRAAAVTYGDGRGESGAHIGVPKWPATMGRIIGPAMELIGKPQVY